MGPFLQEHPGFLFVIATLLPLASFVFLLLVGAVRMALRPKDPAEPGSALFEMLGGHTPARWPAYVATGAIGLAFLVCLIGSVSFIREHSALHAEHGHGNGHAHHGHSHAEGEGEDHDHAHEDAEHAAHEAFEHRWSGSVTWTGINPATAGDKDSATFLTLGYRIDTLSVTMFLMVTFIATLIHLFSMGYMADELAPVVEDHQVHTADGHLHRRGRFGRFFLFLSLFCFSMLNLILADNLFQVFLSWELVGICSFLLIGFYYERQSASNAANKAFITNRIGDAGFIVGLLILWTYLGSFNFEEIFARLRAPRQDAHGDAVRLAGNFLQGEAVDTTKQGGVNVRLDEQGSTVLLIPRQPHLHAENLVAGETVTAYATPTAKRWGTMPYWLLTLAGLGIFLGCVGKSAQFPLHVWLPDAMEGPTPVSALIHAATMVAAGVYLVGRVYPLFTPEARLVIAYTGGITLFVAATIALVMTDIKKVLAYSTVSQLGYMMLALGVGGWAAGLFHLVTHAFFKALLFLGSGSVIYGCHHEQEMTKMGGLYPKMKTTALTMLAGVLAIAGIPLFSGWYSKDAILAHAFGFVAVHREHLLLLLLPLVTAGLTTFYMFRMWLMTFAGRPRDHHVYEHAHESPWLMTVPLVILAVFSIIVAWGWPVWDAEASLLEGHIHHSQHHSVRADFGPTPDAPLVLDSELLREHYYAHEYHALAGALALGMVLLGIVFAFAIYYYRVLDPADAVESFPALHRFLAHKWYFDELYSAVLVRPALTVATWCRAFDARVIDGAVHALARGTVRVTKWNGQFDLGVIDGLVNLIARAALGLGGMMRHVQTGYLRSYVLFLALAAVGIFAVLTYFMAWATAG